VCPRFDSSGSRCFDDGNQNEDAMAQGQEQGSQDVEGR
jgi:hypothetical protein